MNQNRDANERFDRLLKAMVSGPPVKSETQEHVELPKGDRRRKPGPRC